jgi:hypothetical protein
MSVLGRRVDGQRLPAILNIYDSGLANPGHCLPQ